MPRFGSYSLVAFIIFALVAGNATSRQTDVAITPTPLSVPIVPTFPPSEFTLPVVSDLMDVDENCLLPCFWGFHLDESTTQETTVFVTDTFQEEPHVSYATERSETLAESELSSTRGIDFYETFLPLSSEGGSLQVVFGSIDDVLVRINIQLFMAINWLENNPFIFSELLNSYGEPTYIYMRYSGAPTIAYDLAIVYEKQGFIVEYHFGSNTSASERITDDERLLICVEDPTYDVIDLTLQIDGNPMPLIEILQPSLDDEVVFRPFWSIEAMTGLNVHEFTEVFAGNPDTCIEAYSLSELRERGYE